MARRTYPRPEAHHANAAANILAHHAAVTGHRVELPVPVDLIIEMTYGLTVLWDEIAEPPGSMVLGALYPNKKRIVMNTRHSDLFERVIGPEQFTLAHELAHWIYDADDPNQMMSDRPATHRFCYRRDSPALAHDLQIREVNANKLASHLLLPEQLVGASDIDELLDDFAATAARWGVSRQTLRIRLETLGLLDDLDLQRLDRLI